ncbi:MAG TPA: isoleucine--tRNA ligase [Sedimentisphaerales bacterium]|nr:isoleucine--tRNA ligase [Sedimentisphaerales bacterium]
MSEKKEHGYHDTLNLPAKTAFGMKANLLQKEPQQRKQWAKTDIYGQIRKARKGRPMFTLHDGPPYANGDIHMGHVINKVLKDFVVKYKTMSGFDAPYVPGWDCHGLPIEARVMTELGDKARDMSRLDVRRACMKYASKYVKLQSLQFQQLGIFGDFENPYLTFTPGYEAGILEVFAELVDKGLVYKQLRPIHWSIPCQTALAEAELEYKDVSSPSVFVNFPVTEETTARLIELGLIDKTAAESAQVCFMIWTTTPWTLTANLAVAVHPGLEYTAISYESSARKFISVLATERVDPVIAAGGLQNGQYSRSPKTVSGRQLEGLRYRHPFVEHNPTDKDCYMVIPAEYVTVADGTGMVHTAPGHGVEDYLSGQKYGLAIYSPVDDDGCYDDTVPEWLRGKSVREVDRTVSDYLKEKGWLYAQTEIMHSYPHCWRSKTPVIFRATEQWFISVDRELPGAGKSLRDLALDSIGKVKWIPAWGQKRIEGMLQSRPDWCISRQRSWGLPIPVFVNSHNQPLLTKDSVLAAARHIGAKGSDSWFINSPRQILGDSFILPDGFGFDDLRKEENIFDVWFESGCSWYSAAQKAGWPVPVDLYLEGSDQHRGWFQLSLLPALAALGQPPFKSVLTHGFSVDEKGMKQSKSLGNYVNAQEEVAKYGSDILRLWVASVNYQEDVRCTDELIGRTQDAYRKIRNTLKFLFGNIDDFDPDKNAVPYGQMSQIDRWAMQQLQKLIAGVTEAYEEFAYHRVFSLIYNFCTIETSSIYMDVLKDTLYCQPADSPSRRSAQTAVSRILDALVRMLAPILVHTAEEAWAAMKFKSETVDSVHLAGMPIVDESIDRQSQQQSWDTIMDMRDQVLRVLEDLRREKEITSNQQACVTVYCSNDDLAVLKDFGCEQFAALCIVSEVKLQQGEGETRVEAAKSTHQKCHRCWNYWPSVGTDKQHPDLCRRCVDVVDVSR